jgi:hypothetical protein
MSEFKIDLFNTVCLYVVMPSMCKGEWNFLGIECSLLEKKTLMFPISSYILYDFIHALSWVGGQGDFAILGSDTDMLLCLLFHVSPHFTHQFPPLIGQ